jgi:hypothetical protein
MQVNNEGLMNWPSRARPYLGEIQHMLSLLRLSPRKEAASSPVKGCPNRA